MRKTLKMFLLSGLLLYVSACGIDKIDEEQGPAPGVSEDMPSYQDIGLYNPTPEGGRTAGVSAINQTLREEGFNVSEFSHITMDNLLQFPLIIIPNTREMADDQNPRWGDKLRTYVVECGGSIIFNHDAVGAERSPFGRLPLFPEIAAPGSVKRGESHEAEVSIPYALEADYDYLPGYQQGQKVEHMYFDRFMFDLSDRYLNLLRMGPFRDE